MRGLEYADFALPEIKGPQKLPVVLNGSEVKAMFKACNSLKQRLLIGFCYDCGLRSSEVQYLQVSHVDLERRMLHVHQGKGSKDRCVPLGKLLWLDIEIDKLTNSIENILTGEIFDTEIVRLMDIDKR